MCPMRMRLLGASVPRSREGTIIGAANAAALKALVFRKSRRETAGLAEDLIDFIVLELGIK